MDRKFPRDSARELMAEPSADRGTDSRLRKRKELVDNNLSPWLDIGKKNILSLNLSVIPRKSKSKPP